MEPSKILKEVHKGLPLGMFVITFSVVGGYVTHSYQLGFVWVNHAAILQNYPKNVLSTLYSSP
jgi:hypothetical protein